MKVTGIVFDMDGTLVNLGGFVDWEHAHRQAKGAYLECGCPPEVMEELGERNLFDMMNLVRHENLRSMDDETVRSIKSRVYLEVEECELEGMRHCSLMPGCVETLDWIWSRGITMGVATPNSELVAESVLVSGGSESISAPLLGGDPSSG